MAGGDAIPTARQRANGFHFYFAHCPCDRCQAALAQLRECAECNSARQERRRRKAREADRKAAAKPGYKERRQEYNQRPEVRERRRANERKRYAADPQKHIRKVQRYYAANAERLKANARKRGRGRAPSDPMREKARKRTKEWAANNPDRARRNAKVSKHRRRALAAAAAGSFTADDIAAILEAQRGRCAYCPKRIRRSYHVDHIIALSRGGSNARSNLQLLCADCNLAKGARDPLDHARSLGKLL